MGRRNPNKHVIVRGVWKKHGGTKVPSRTAAGRGRTYFAYPPETGWPGGLPELNGYHPALSKRN